MFWGGENRHVGKEFNNNLNQWRERVLTTLLNVKFVGMPSCYSPLKGSTPPWWIAVHATDLNQFTFLFWNKYFFLIISLLVKKVVQTIVGLSRPKFRSNFGWAFSNIKSVILGKFIQLIFNNYLYLTILIKGSIDIWTQIFPI